MLFAAEPIKLATPAPSVEAVARFEYSQEELPWVNAKRPIVPYPVLK